MTTPPPHRLNGLKEPLTPTIGSPSRNNVSISQDIKLVDVKSLCLDMKKKLGSRYAVEGTVVKPAVIGTFPNRFEGSGTMSFYSCSIKDKEDDVIKVSAFGKIALETCDHFLSGKTVRIEDPFVKYADKNFRMGTTSPYELRVVATTVVTTLEDHSYVHNWVTIDDIANGSVTPGTKVTISGYAESISALSDDKETATSYEREFQLRNNNNTYTVHLKGAVAMSLSSSEEGKIVTYGPLVVDKLGKTIILDTVTYETKRLSGDGTLYVQEPKQEDTKKREDISNSDSRNQALVVDTDHPAKKLSQAEQKDPIDLKPSEVDKGTKVDNEVKPTMNKELEEEKPENLTHDKKADVQHKSARKAK